MDHTVKAAPAIMRPMATFPFVDPKKLSDDAPDCRAGAAVLVSARRILTLAGDKAANEDLCEADRVSAMAGGAQTPTPSRTIRIVAAERLTLCLNRHLLQVTWQGRKVETAG